MNLTATREGYTFKGWNTDYKGSTGLSSLKVGTSNIILYAICTPNTYNVTYNFNEANNMTSWKYFFQEQFNIVYDNTTKTNTISFTGVGAWEIPYVAMETIVGKKYTISFDYNNPNGYSPNCQILTNVTNSDNASNSIASTYLYTNGTTQNMIVEFTATTTTTYLAFNFGTVADGIPFTMQIGNFKLCEKQKHNEQLGILPKIETAGYTLNGWYTTPTGGTKISSITAVPAHDVTYYAQWKANTYNVIFDSHKTAFDGSDQLIATFSGRNYYKKYAGVAYVGYWYDGNYTAPILVGTTADAVAYYTTHDYSVLPSSGNFTYLGKTYYYSSTGQWMGGDLVDTSGTLELKFSGSSYSMADISKKILDANISVIPKVYGTQLGTLLTPTKKGYTFRGWYTAPSGGTQISTSTTVLANNVTYYAQWNDATAPGPVTVTYNGGSNTCSWKNNYNLTLSANDIGSGIAYYQGDWNGDGTADWSGGSNLIPSNGHSSCVNKFRAVDNAGNVGPWTEAHHIHMDTEAPVKTSINLNGYTSGIWTNKNVAINASATDNIGIKHYEYSHDGGKSVYAIMGYDSYKNPWLIDWDGQFDMWIRAVDYAGNPGPWSDGFTVRIDKTAPSITTVTYNGGSNTCSWKNNYNMTFSASDNTSGIAYYQGNWYDNGEVNWSSGSNLVPGNGHSSCTNRFRAVDNAGNVGPWSEIQHIHMDTQAPSKTSVNLNGYSSGSWAATDVTQTASASDNVGIAYYEYSHDGINVAASFPSNPWTINWNGEWNFWVRAVDHAGNRGAWSDMYTIRRNVRTAYVTGIDGGSVLYINSQPASGYTIGRLHNNDQVWIHGESGSWWYVYAHSRIMDSDAYDSWMYGWVYKGYITTPQ